jgi:hypothetical protein
LLQSPRCHYDGPGKSTMAQHSDPLSERQRQRAAWEPHKTPWTRRSFRCQCGLPVFFRNSRCLACGSELGYAPQHGELLSIAPTPAVASAWHALRDGEDGPSWRRCSNFSLAGCNWLLSTADPEKEGLCLACRLNRTIPDLSNARHVQLWSRIELSKRRVVSQLIALGLPIDPKPDETSEPGLAFDFLASWPDGSPVLTGHAKGLITLNIEEADPAARERARQAMDEPYRTLLGHLRHETGHYYWDLLVRDTDWLEPFRALFGDERQDYKAALQASYDQGPPADWATRFITSYASSHPWEDWAETWAHYLHMLDTIDTALSFGIDADNIDIEAQAWGRDALWRPDDATADVCLGFVNAWVEVTAALNEMSRSMGQNDFYPFVMPRAAIAKLHFIHLLVQGRPAIV